MKKKEQIDLRFPGSVKFVPLDESVPNKATLPILVVDEPTPVGTEVSMPDGQKMEVVRELTKDQVKEIAPQLYSVIHENIPPGVPLYFIECRPINHA